MGRAVNVLTSLILEGADEDQARTIRAALTPAAVVRTPTRPTPPRSPLPHKPHVQPPDWWHGEAEAAREALSARDWLARGGDG